MGKSELVRNRSTIFFFELLSFMGCAVLFVWRLHLHVYIFKGALRRQSLEKDGVLGKKKNDAAVQLALNSFFPA